MVAYSVMSKIVPNVRLASSWKKLEELSFVLLAKFKAVKSAMRLGIVLPAMNITI